MQIKEWLNRGRVSEGMIEALIEEKEQCKKQLFSSYTNDNYKKLFQEYLNYEKQINQEIDKLIHIKQEIFEVIRLIPPGRHRQVLQLRYLCMVDTWDKISEKMHYERSWVQRGLHSQALEKARKIWEKSCIDKK